MKEVVVIKLGGSVITDKETPYTLRQDIINRLAKEIAQAKSQMPNTYFIVGNGAGSFGHHPAKLYGIQNGLVDEKSMEGVAVTRFHVQQLNNVVVKALMDQNLPAISMQTSALVEADRGEIVKSTFDQINNFLNLGFVVVPYGDVVFDRAQGVSIASTETILDSLITEWVKSNQFIVKTGVMISNIDGVYKDMKAKEEIFENITSQNFLEVTNSLQDPSGADVTGGMLHKIESALEFTKYGMQTHVVNGLAEGRVMDSILGKEVLGTKIS